MLGHHHVDAMRAGRRSVGRGQAADEWRQRGGVLAACAGLSAVAARCRGPCRHVQGARGGAGSCRGRGRKRESRAWVASGLARLSDKPLSVCGRCAGAKGRRGERVLIEKCRGLPNAETRALLARCALLTPSWHRHRSGPASPQQLQWLRRLSGAAGRVAGTSLPLQHLQRLPRARWTQQVLESAPIEQRSLHCRRQHSPPLTAAAHCRRRQPPLFCRRRAALHTRAAGLFPGAAQGGAARTLERQHSRQHHQASDGLPATPAAAPTTAAPALNRSPTLNRQCLQGAVWPSGGRPPHPGRPAAPDAAGCERPVACRAVLARHVSRLAAGAPTGPICSALDPSRLLACLPAQRAAAWPSASSSSMSSTASRPRTKPSAASHAR